MNTNSKNTRGIKLIELDARPTNVYLCPKRPHEIVPGVTATVGSNAREALIEVSHSQLPSEIFIDNKPVFSVKPWHAQQVLRIDTRQFVHLPHLGFYAYSNRTAQRQSLLELDLLAYQVPASFPAKSTDIKKLGRRSMLLLTGCLFAAVSAIGLVNQAQQESPSPISRVKTMAPESRPIQLISKEFKASEEPSKAVADPSSSTSGQVSPQATDANRPAKPPKNSRQQMATSQSGRLSMAERETIRTQLQRLSLEARFDPERAKAKMKNLLESAKGHTELTAIIRQEIALID